MSKTTTQKTVSDPWAPAQGALQDVIEASTNLYNSGGMQVDPYTGRRVADFSPETLQGMQGLQAGSNVTPMAENAFAGFMDDGARNRAFDQMKATTIADTKAALGSTLAGGGLNTGLGAQQFGRGMADAIGGIEYGAWGDAQNRKLSAMGMAPQIAGLGRSDAAGQLAAGGMRDQLAQQNINADMAQYYEGQQAPMDALNQYAQLSAMMGGMGGASNTTQRKPWSLADFGKVVSGVGSFF